MAPWYMHRSCLPNTCVVAVVKTCTRDRRASVSLNDASLPRQHVREFVCVLACSYVVTNRCYCSHGFLDAVAPSELPDVSAES